MTLIEELHARLEAAEQERAAIAEAWKTTSANFATEYERRKAAEQDATTLREALEALVELGRKDTSNSKYNDYYETAKAALVARKEASK